MEREKFTKLLEKEITPALGVTEVGAIALASSAAYDIVGGTPLKIRMVMNGGMYKNAFSCGIPGTKELGCEMAALLGVFGAESGLGLECLKPVTQENADRAKASGIPVNISVDEKKDHIFIEAEVTTTEGIGFVRIEDLHDKIVLAAKDDQILFQEEAKPEAGLNETFDFENVTVAELVEYAQTAPLEDLRPVKKMIEMNTALAEKGEKGVGMSIWKTLSAFREKGVVGSDMIYEAQKLTCSAMDARLAGLPYPAMSIVGSGSHGILCSLPVVSYGRSIGASEEAVLRAVTLSCLITAFSKHYTGRLSSLCGCVLGGGSGSASGIVLLMGGGLKEVEAAMDHVAANLTGMICDGGSTGCALKAYSGVASCFLAAMLSMQGIAIPHNFGVIGSTAEQTERNLGRISDEGMAPMDPTILSIMQLGK